MSDTVNSGPSRSLLWTLAIVVAAAIVAWRSEPDSAPKATAATAIDAGIPGLFTATPELDFAWPPKLGEPFPDLELVSHTGAMVRLSDFRGKVVLVEPIGMTCAACNAFSGAGERGGYENIKPQADLPSIDELLPRYAGGQALDDDRLVLVQLLLYDMNLKAPSAADARAWAQHFGFDGKPNTYVLAADKRFINKASYDMIPGFFLLDKDLILRADATGHRPKHNLFTYLLAKVPELLVGPANAEPVTNVGMDFELSMTVAEAYRAIPHNQTTFSGDAAAMAAVERRFMESLFELTDFAMAERVQSLHWYQTQGRRGSAPRNYDALIARLDALDAPAELGTVKDLIHSAVKQQRAYFATLDESRKLKFEPGHKLVQSSHRKLIKAYQLLMSQFPHESAHNKQAFYDHLCALDFI